MAMGAGAITPAETTMILITEGKVVCIVATGHIRHAGVMNDACGTTVVRDWDHFLAFALEVRFLFGFLANFSVQAGQFQFPSGGFVNPRQLIWNYFISTNHKEKVRKETCPFNIAIIVVTSNHLSITRSLTDTVWNSILVDVCFSVYVERMRDIGGHSSSQMLLVRLSGFGVRFIILAIVFFVVS
jgi:hypothetical protein